MPEVAGKARSLVLRLGGATPIDGIDLDIARGAFTMLMGSNGAGKSLLLRLLHGLVAPSAGTVRWDDRTPDETVRRTQAMVFQRPVLLRRSALANVRFATPRSGAAGRERALAALDEVGLADRAGQPARLLSGGEQQRLSLACALVRAPRVLFLDEPTASLDPAATAAIEAIVRRAHARGTTVVFVTHDPGQARRLGQEIVFLDRGRVAEHSPAERFFDAPRSTAAREFLAARLALR